MQRSAFRKLCLELDKTSFKHCPLKAFFVPSLRIGGANSISLPLEAQLNGGDVRSDDPRQHLRENSSLTCRMLNGTACEKVITYSV